MVLALDTSVPLRHLHSVATFPGVAPYPSYHPPPPLNFFYRIAQLLYGFALCGFHLIFGLGGRRLLQAAQSREFDELWVYNIKRLGREVIDLLVLIRQLEPLGVRLVSLQEGEQTGIGYDMQAVLADYDRRHLLKVLADGMNRTAREGRYTGGIVPLGYVVLDRKQHARVTPCDEHFWGKWTEADLVRQIYHWLAVEGWSCRKIADYLNSLGVPTAYSKDGRLIKRGQRKERTQGVWRSGRIRNLARNPVYGGEQHYGRRSTNPDGREVIVAKVPALVSPEIWEAAQKTLSGNRLMAKNTRRSYLLKSVIRCGICGLTYIGSWGRGFAWYRCNGRLTDRGPIPERCLALALKGPDIDAVVWDDIERFLRDPGDILEELAQEGTMDAGAAIAEAERLTLESAMVDLAGRRKKAIDLYTRDQISDAELDELLAEIGRERDGVAKRLDELQEAASEPQEPLDPDLLELNTTTRPFMYTIPLQGSRSRVEFQSGDLCVHAGVGQFYEPMHVLFV